MQIKQIAAAAALIPAISAACLAKKQVRGWCATSPTEKTMESIGELEEAEVTAKRDLSPARPRAPIIIPTYLHAVVNSSASETVLDEASLRVQLDTMNARFSPNDVQFKLEGLTRRVDDALAPGPYGGVRSGVLNPYLKDTHKGGYDTLNLWFYTNFPSDIFGACTMPEADFPESQYWEDGCHIASGTMPGGEIVDYNLGLTAVHEVGHWLGLLHTFEGYACDGDGDHISDTPQEADPTWDCPTSKDSCPEIEGLDPVSNYMDYSIDPCFEEFTPGQQERMHNTYATLREGKTA